MFSGTNNDHVKLRCLPIKKFKMLLKTRAKIHSKNWMGEDACMPTNVIYYRKWYGTKIERSVNGAYIMNVHKRQREYDIGVITPNIKRYTI